MNHFIKEIQPLLPTILRVLELIFLFVCRKEIFAFCKGMLSEDGAGVNLSSRRGIAFAAAWTLFILCIRYYKEINPIVLWVLLLLIVLCLGLATLPQIMDAMGKIKSIIPGSPAPTPDQPQTLKVSKTTETVNAEVTTQPQNQ